MLSQLHGKSLFKLTKCGHNCNSYDHNKIKDFKIYLFDRLTHIKPTVSSYTNNIFNLLFCVIIPNIIGQLAFIPSATHCVYQCVFRIRVSLARWCHLGASTDGTSHSLRRGEETNI